MKILVIGTGVMSNYVLDSIKSSGNICIGRYDKFGNGDFSDFNEINEEFDVIVDFSHHSLTKELLEFAVKKNKNIVSRIIAYGNFCFFQCSTIRLFNEKYLFSEIYIP